MGQPSNEIVSCCWRYRRRAKSAWRPGFRPRCRALDRLAGSSPLRNRVYRTGRQSKQLLGNHVPVEHLVTNPFILEAMQSAGVENVSLMAENLSVTPPAGRLR